MYVTLKKLIVKYFLFFRFFLFLKYVDLSLVAGSLFEDLNKKYADGNTVVITTMGYKIPRHEYDI